MKRISIAFLCVFLFSCSNTKLITENNLLKAKLSESEKKLDEYEKCQEYVFSQYLDKIKDLDDGKNIVQSNQLISASRDFINKFPNNKYVWIAKLIITEKERSLQNNINTHANNKVEIPAIQDDSETEEEVNASKPKAAYSTNKAIKNRLSDPIKSVPKGDFLFVFKLVKVENKIQGVDLEFELLNKSGEFVKNFWVQAELRDRKGKFLKGEELLVIDNVENGKIVKATGVWESVNAYRIGTIKVNLFIIETNSKRNFLETHQILVQPNIFDIDVIF